MKILFLDIDGVLNNEKQNWDIEGNWTISDSSVGILNRLLDEIPDLKIVLSSTWRIASRGQEATFKHLTEKHGFKHASRVIGSTPDFGYRNDAWFLRGEECLEWMNLYHEGEEIEAWAILDDQKDMFLTLPNNHRNKLVITDSQRGFSLREFDKLKEILCSK